MSTTSPVAKAAAPPAMPSRRSLLTAGLVGGGVAAAAGMRATTGVASAQTSVVQAASPAAFASNHTSPGRLAVVYLRGGMDGLSAVVPYTETAYYDARPAIAVPDTAVLDLDGQFGLHPALANLHQLFGAGRLSVVVGAGNLAGDRSHFTAQDLSEFGATSYPADFNGWVGRHLGATAGSDDSLFRSLTMGNNVNLSLRGTPALGMASIEAFGFGGVSGLTANRETTFEFMYAGDSLAELTGTAAIRAAETVGGINGSNSQNATARSLADAATLFDSGLGVEVITLNIGGWDTHNLMGAHDNGTMRDLLLGLDGYLGDFQAALDDGGNSDVTTIVMTEFGRRVEQNGSGGTDHGWATAMFVMGDAATGGVFGADSWVGLDSAAIGSRGDVVPGVDALNVCGDVVAGVLGGNPSVALPGHSYQPVGVVS